MERQYSHEFGAIFFTQIENATKLLNLGSRDEALEIWRDMSARFPDLSLTSEVGFDLALNLGCYDEAEAMIQEGRKRNFGGSEYFFTAGCARIAYRRGNLEEAIRCCGIWRRKYPGVTESYTIAANCLNGLGRFEEAEVMIGRGLLKLPNDFNLHVLHAWCAMRRRAWPEALQRWKMVSSRFEHISGMLGAAECLREMDRFAEAGAMLSDARACFGTDNRVITELANLATAKGDFNEAVQYWEVALQRDPFFAIAYTKGAEAMRKIGRETDADELLRAGLTRLQSDLTVHLEYARGAHRRGDWEAAVDRWALVRDRFPQCAEAREQEAAAHSAVAR